MKKGFMDHPQLVWNAGPVTCQLMLTSQPLNCAKRAQKSLPEVCLLQGLKDEPCLHGGPGQHSSCLILSLASFCVFETMCVL